MLFVKYVNVATEAALNYYGINICGVLILVLLIIAGIWLYHTYTTKVLVPFLIISILMFSLLILLTDLVKTKKHELKDYSYYDSYHNKLPLEEWMVYKEGDEYFLISRDNGTIYPVLKEDYIKYEVCPNIEIVRYLKTTSYTGMLVTVKSEETKYDVHCFPVEDDN